jgi:hypothetical protein
MQAMNPPKRTAQCLYLCHVSRLIKATDGSSNDYTDSYFQCNKNKPHRISGKKLCKLCVNYKPIINYADEFDK